MFKSRSRNTSFGQGYGGVAHRREGERVASQRSSVLFAVSLSAPLTAAAWWGLYTYLPPIPNMATCVVSRMAQLLSHCLDRSRFDFSEGGSTLSLVHILKGLIPFAVSVPVLLTVAAQWRRLYNLYCLARLDGSVNVLRSLVVCSVDSRSLVGIIYCTYLPPIPSITTCGFILFLFFLDLQ